MHLKAFAGFLISCRDRTKGSILTVSVLDKTENAGPTLRTRAGKMYCTNRLFENDSITTARYSVAGFAGFAVICKMCKHKYLNPRVSVDSRVKLGPTRSSLPIANQLLLMMARGSLLCFLQLLQ